jgi:hypothetical protein
MPVYPGASVQQQRHHQRRLIRRPTMAIGAVVGVERAQVQLLDRAQDAPHEVILRDPIQQRRRQQRRLLAVARDEVLRHPGIQLIDPDETAFPDSHTQFREPVRRRRGRLRVVRGGSEPRIERPPETAGFVKER